MKNKEPAQYRAAGGVRYEFKRKRVKNINLRVRADGSVAVSAPLGAPLAQVDAFVAGRARWIEAARAVGTSGAESDYYERNARNILTTWGDRDQSLNDYANRTWAGLVAAYYKPRWELFCDAALEAVESGAPFDEAAFTERCRDFEWAWVNSTDKSGLNAGRSAAKPVAGMLYAKYKSQIE